MIEQVNENVYLTIWSDIANGGTPFWVLLSLLIFFYLKEYIITLIKSLIDLVQLKINHKIKEKTIKDLQNHQLFRDIQYWLVTGIEAIHLINNAHDKDEEYIKGKEEIAKDVIKIKLETIDEFFSKFISENDLDNMDYELAHRYIDDTIAKCRITQMHKMLKSGIPLKFLEKYEVFSKINNKCLVDTLNTFFRKDFELSTITRVYLVLNAVDGYLNIIFNSISEAINSINGDLMGEEYHGHIIGSKKKKFIKVPSTQSYNAVMDKLNDYIKEFDCSRVCVNKIHSVENTNLSTGYHSCIYEKVNVGITSELEHLQYIPNNLDSEMMTIMDKGENIAVDISKFSNEKAQHLLDRGVRGIIMAPIFNDDKLDGFVSFDYLSMDDFKKVSSRKDLDNRLNEISNILSPYIIYPENYKF